MEGAPLVVIGSTSTCIPSSWSDSSSRARWVLRWDDSSSSVRSITRLDIGENFLLEEVRLMPEKCGNTRESGSAPGNTPRRS